MIAEQDHVQPEDVTLEHIRQKREQNPNANFDFSTRIGGYNRPGGHVLTVAQSREVIRSAYKFLSSFGKTKKS